MEDRRNHFDPLIDTTSEGCCTIEVRRSDAASGSLQGLIGEVVLVARGCFSGRTLRDGGVRLIRGFKPGRP
ncbi:MAG TPA: hypothetical protein VGD71_21205 [Kribbella sp.]